MTRKTNRSIVSIIFLSILFLMVGCASSPLKIPITPINGRKYEKLGKVSATASGFMLLNFIPIGQNGKFERVYLRAVREKGGDALINPSLTEQWRWTPLGNVYHIIITGEAIRYIE